MHLPKILMLVYTKVPRYLLCIDKSRVRIGVGYLLLGRGANTLGRFLILISNSRNISVGMNMY